MIASGYLPVGKDFPVFLHPRRARNTRSRAPSASTAAAIAASSSSPRPEVTLEDDLRRRDLTINAMARAPDGTLIDPYHGQDDLREGVLRHVSEAFGEDPLRVLRVARFAARFGFTVAPQTEAMMRAIVASGELDTLAPERVWQELSRGLMEPWPSRMLAVLRECGALAVLLPEVDALYGVPQPPAHHPEIDTGVHVARALDWSAEHGLSLPARYASWRTTSARAITTADSLPRHIAHEQRSVRLAERLSARLRCPSTAATPRGSPRAGTASCIRALELTPAKLLDLIDRPPTRCAVPSGSTISSTRAAPTRARDRARRGLSAGRADFASALAVVRSARCGRGRGAGAPALCARSPDEPRSTTRKESRVAEAIRAPRGCAARMEEEGGA
jgi:tRNA nucleotidyltransferase (CCA-adding enzyme)